MRIFGNKNNVGQYTLFLNEILIGSFNVVTSFIFGLLIDKFGYKIINIIISCIEIGVSWTFFFSAQIYVIFCIEIVLISCCLSGTFTTITPLFNKVFGKELALEISGIAIIFLFVSEIPGELLINLIVKREKDFLIIYFIGGGISLIKFIALFFFKENEPYIFKENKEEEYYNNIEKINDIGIDK